MDNAGFDFDSTAVSSASSEPRATPAVTTTSESVSAECTTRSQPPTGVGGKRARHARASVQASGVGTTGGVDTHVPRVKRRALVWAVPYLSDGIMQRARRWAWLLRGPADLPPSNGILMGFHAGLPAKRLRIPKVSGRARAQGRGPVRGVAGSLGNSPPEGVIRGIPSACDPVPRSARGPLQVLAPSDQGLRPLRRCDRLYVRSELVPQLVGFLSMFSLDGWEQISRKVAEWPADRPTLCTHVDLKSSFWSFELRRRHARVFHFRLRWEGEDRIFCMSRMPFGWKHFPLFCQTAVPDGANPDA